MEVGKNDQKSEKMAYLNKIIAILTKNYLTFKMSSNSCYELL